MNEKRAIWVTPTQRGILTDAFEQMDGAVSHPYSMEDMVATAQVLTGETIDPITEPPTRADGYYGRTMNAGQMIDWLMQFDRDMPVTIGYDIKCSECDHENAWWANIEQPMERMHPDEEKSVVFITTDDFDPRQW